MPTCKLDASNLQQYVTNSKYKFVTIVNSINVHQTSSDLVSQIIYLL